MKDVRVETNLGRFLMAFQDCREYQLKHSNCNLHNFQEYTLIEVDDLSEYNRIWEHHQSMKKVYKNTPEIDFYTLHIAAGDYDECFSVTFYDEERQEEFAVIKVVCNDERLFQSPPIGDILSIQSDFEMINQY